MGTVKSIFGDVPLHKNRRNGLLSSYPYKTQISLVKKMTTKELVNRVIDGDTFETDQNSRSVRLEGLNAPEIDTHEGERAKQYLANVILHEFVDIDVVARDSYGRRIAKVWLNGVSVNETMNNLLG